MEAQARPARDFVSRPSNITDPILSTVMRLQADDIRHMEAVVLAFNRVYSAYSQDVQEMISYFYLHGNRQQDVAEHMEVSPSTLRHWRKLVCGSFAYRMSAELPGVKWWERAPQRVPKKRSPGAPASR